MNDGALMIFKLRPQYDEAFPPGYFENRDYPPDNFDGHAWLASLPGRVVQADIEPHIYRNAAYFSDRDIWYYACFPRGRVYHVWQLCTFTVLASGLPGRTDQVMLMVSDALGDKFDSAVVLHNEDRIQLGQTVINQMCLLIDDWKGRVPVRNWDFWDRYDAPGWYRLSKAGGEFNPNYLKRVVP